MAWVLAAIGNDLAGAAIVLSEEAGAASKTLVWGTDLASSLGEGLVKAILDITGVRVELSTGAASTARHIVVQVLDSADDVVMEMESANDFATAASTRAYEFARGFGPGTGTVELTTTIGTIIRAPLPADLVLVPGMKLKVLDKNAADATDSVVVHVRGRSRA